MGSRCPSVPGSVASPVLCHLLALTIGCAGLHPGTSLVLRDPTGAPCLSSPLDFTLVTTATLPVPPGRLATSQAEQGPSLRPGFSPEPGSSLLFLPGSTLPLSVLSDFLHRLLGEPLSCLQPAVLAALPTPLTP